MFKKTLVGVCAAALLVAVPVHAAKSLVGKPAPDFTLQTMDGKQFKLSDLKDKKAVVLSLTQSACRNCVHELKLLTTFVGKNKNLEIYAVNVDAKNGTPAWQARMAEIYKEFEISIPTLLDGKFTVGKAFKVSATPSLIVIKKDGTVADIRIGYNPEEDEKEVTEIINKLK